MKISSKKLKERLGAGWEIESIESPPKPKKKPKPIPQTVVSKPEPSAETTKTLINIADAIVKKRIDEHLEKSEVPEKKKAIWRFEIHRDRNGFAKSITAIDENEKRMKWDFEIFRNDDGLINNVVTEEL